MEINIIDDKKNPLLSRREIVCMVTKKGTTPSKNDVAIQITNELKLKKECVFVDAVYQKYGRPSSEVHVRVYDRKELVPGYEKPKKDADSTETKKDSAESKEEKAPENKEEVKEEKKEEPKKEEAKPKEEKAPENKEEVKEEKKEEPKKEEAKPKEEKAPDAEKKQEASKKDDTKKE